MAGFWALLGVSWPLLAASGALSGVSWTLLGVSVAPHGCILASRGAPSVDFGRFGASKMEPKSKIFQKIIEKFIFPKIGVLLKRQHHFRGREGPENLENQRKNVIDILVDF